MDARDELFSFFLDSRASSLACAPLTRAFPRSSRGPLAALQATQASRILPGRTREQPLHYLCLGAIVFLADIIAVYCFGPFVSALVTSCVSVQGQSNHKFEMLIRLTTFKYLHVLSCVVECLHTLSN